MRPGSRCVNVGIGLLLLTSVLVHQQPPLRGHAASHGEAGRHQSAIDRRAGRSELCCCPALNIPGLSFPKHGTYTALVAPRT